MLFLLFSHVNRWITRLDLDISLGFHLIEEGRFQILPGGDLLVEEAHGEIKGMVEGGANGVL